MLRKSLLTVIASLATFADAAPVHASLLPMDEATGPTCQSPFSETLLVIWSPVWFAPADPSLVDVLYAPFFPRRVYVADQKCSACETTPSPTGERYVLFDANATAREWTQHPGALGWSLHLGLLEVVSNKYPKLQGGYLFVADDVEVHFERLLPLFDAQKLFHFDARGGPGGYPGKKLCGDSVTGLGGQEGLDLKGYELEAECFFSQLGVAEEKMLQANGLAAHALCEAPQNDVFFLPARHAAAWARLASVATSCGLSFVVAYASLPLMLDRVDNMVRMPNSYYLYHPGDYEKTLDSAIFSHPVKWMGGGACDSTHVAGVTRYVDALPQTCPGGAAAEVAQRAQRSINECN